MLSAQREVESSNISHTAFQYATESDSPLQTAALQQAMTTTATLYAPQTTSSNVQLSCLYTKHKTQKRKVWQDGRLVLHGQLRAVLHNANPAVGSSDPVIDQCELASPQMQSLQHCGVQLEMEKHLVTVEGPWNGSQQHRIIGAPVAAAPLPSSGMLKVLTKKYQAPAKKAPNPPNMQAAASVLARRKRPLQPGELQRQYYGVAATAASEMQGAGQQYLQMQVPYSPATTLPPQQHEAQQPVYAPMKYTMRPPAATANQPPLNQFQQQQHSFTFNHAPAQHHQSSTHNTQQQSTPPPHLPPTAHQQQQQHQAASFQPQQQPAALHQPPIAANQSTRQSEPAPLRKKQKPSLIRNNGFDPHSFYDKDDSDDEDELGFDVNRPPQQFVVPSPRPVPFRIEHGTEHAENPGPFIQPEAFRMNHALEQDISANTTQPSLFQSSHEAPSPTIRKPPTGTTDGTTMTDYELLALFGAAPPKPAGEFSLPDQDDSSSSDEDS
ncbi:hypothetical protein MPSEU_000343700 [Mayamaea pseudoterrestris]|nr:hypothetical protein MPSEU_000343700 [Mayamaea pseudoterrestris]